MKTICLVISLLSFFIYRPYVIQRSGMIYEGDDRQYLAHATSLAFGQFPSYTLEGNTSPAFAYSWGPGLLAAPFVWLFSWLDRWDGNPIVLNRGLGDVKTSWAAFGFVMATQFYFLLGILFLFLAVSHTGSHSEAAILFISVASAGVLLYVYRRPVFAHIYEFCSVSFAIWLLCQVLPLSGLQNSSLSLGWMVLASFSIYLTRYNNLPVAYAFLYSFVMAKAGYKPTQVTKVIQDRRISVKLFLMTFIFAALVYSVHILGSRAVVDEKILPVISRKTTMLFLLTNRGIRFYIERTVHILFGLDWGLLYTAPLALIGLAGYWRWPGTAYFAAPLLALVVNLYICLCWGTQASWYGYRYLLFALLPLSTLGMALFLNQKVVDNRRWFYALAMLAILSLIPAFLFEGNSTTLTLHNAEEGWINNQYLVMVWKTVMTHPQDAMIILLKGGPLYLVYLFAAAFGKTAMLPAEVLVRYPVFELKVVFKSVLIWIFPSVFAWLSAPWIKRSMETSS